jgi:CRISPR-associated protein Cmr1
MKTTTYRMEFITPCFCAGANPSVAEVRAPSIRGKLRWWFRVVGGSFAQESEVFGSITGDEGRGSALIVRVRESDIRAKWQPVQFTGISNTGYLLYFAKASANGARWAPTGALPSGSTFDLLLTWRRGLTLETQAIFDCALDAFLLLGSLGLRGSRGLGSFHCAELPYSNDAFQDLLCRIKRSSPNFLAGLSSFSGSNSQVLDGLGAQLRGLRKGYSAGPPGRSNPTPLGSSQPRQASAVYLRPVLDSGNYRLVVFEAPAERVLGRESRGRAPRLQGGVPPLGHAPQGFRGHRRN